MASRRYFLKSGAVLGLAALVAPAHGLARSRRTRFRSAAGALDPLQTQQFVNPLPNPLHPAFLAVPDRPGSNSYTMTIREITRQLGITTGPGRRRLDTVVWGYGSSKRPASFPGPTFEVQRGTTLTVTFVNGLTDPRNNPLPNRMPVDTTLDWANPGAVGGITPVPAVAHLHGGGNPYLSDGLPEAWETPDGQMGRLFARPYTYENRQEAAILWYHDHALGITRTNVYMGLAGFYLIRDDNENRLRKDGILPSYPYEIPIVIQDRMFLSDGSLFYPAEAEPEEGGEPTPLPAPTHLPEFFGNVILVNGQAWPKLDVEPRKYRFRLLNGSDSRFYDLRIQGRDGRSLPILVIGNELGLLDRPAIPDLAGEPNVLSIAPGERYDLVIDFSRFPAGSRFVMTNTARSPYPNADPPEPGLTDRILAFQVTPLKHRAIPDATVQLGTNLRPEHGPLPPVDATGARVRRILLFEGTDVYGRLQTMLGTVDPDPHSGLQGTLTFKDPVTEKPAAGTQEVWEFYNTTVDAHPVHMHQVDFRILDRQAFTADLEAKKNSDGSDGAVLKPESIALSGPARRPAAWEAGRKDTVIAYPGEVTRVLVSFDRRGEYVYHCHILSHEDHEMMRRYEVI